MDRSPGKLKEIWKKAVRYVKYGTTEAPLDGVRFAESEFLTWLHSVPSFILAVTALAVSLYGLPWFIWTAFDIPESKHNAFYSFYLIILFAVILFLLNLKMTSNRKDRMIEDLRDQLTKRQIGDDIIGGEEGTFAPRRRLPMERSDFDLISVGISILDELIIKELDPQRKRSLNRIHILFKGLPWVTTDTFVEVSMGNSGFAVRGSSLELYSYRYSLEVHAGGKRYEDGNGDHWVSEIQNAAASSNVSVIDESRDRIEKDWRKHEHGN